MNGKSAETQDGVELYLYRRRDSKGRVNSCDCYQIFFFYVLFFSMFVSKMLCEAEGAISAISSAAVSRCSTNGRDTGDSTSGSRASSGVMKCARTHCLGSSTSRTDSGLPGLFLSATGACCVKTKARIMNRAEFTGHVNY